MRDFVIERIDMLLQRATLRLVRSYANGAITFVFGLVASIAQRQTVRWVERQLGVCRTRLDVVCVQVMRIAAVLAFAVSRLYEARPFGQLLGFGHVVYVGLESRHYNPKVTDR